MKRTVVYLAALLLAIGTTVRAGELDSEFGTKAKPIAPTASFTAPATPGTELDGESPAQARFFGRFGGFGFRGFGFGGYGFGYRPFGFGGFGGFGYRPFGFGYRPFGFGYPGFGFGFGYPGFGFGGFGFRRGFWW